MSNVKTTKEPSFEKISGLYTRPRTKRILINGPLDYKLIEVRPDFTLIMKDATLKSKRSRIGFGFAEGEIPELFNFKETEQSLHEDCIPIACSKIKKNDIEYIQTAFTAENDGRRNTYIRIQATNLHPRSKREATLWFTIIQKEHDDLYEIINEDYLPYNTLKEPWFDGVALEKKDDFLVQYDNIILAYKTSSGITAEYMQKCEHGSNLLKFPTELEPGDTKIIEMIIPYEGLMYVESEKGQEYAVAARSKFRCFYSSRSELSGISFDEIHEKAVLQWKTYLRASTRINVTDEVIEKVYNTLTLNSLQMLVHLPERPYYIAGQGGFNDFRLVYGWESSFLLTAMDSQGYHAEVRKVLDFFLSIQDGSEGPEGDIQSAEGTFRPSIHWMCETGAILKIFGMHYLYTNDKEWLVSIAPKLVKACRWIIEERKATKQLNDDGIKVKHYGLLPKGRVHDWPDKGYFFFSDAYTYEGFKIVAEALNDIGHPEGAGILQEVEDYRQCILRAVEYATHEHPCDKDNIFIANEVYGTPDKIMTSYGLDGPVALLAAGLIPPEDEKVPLIELGLRQLGILSDLFALKLYKMEDDSLEELLLKKSGGKYDLYYVNGAERVWHKVWLERGEFEKALRYFYSTIAFSTTMDTGHCNERFCPQMPWLVPWQPNASGNGRIIEMIHRTLFYEKDGCLNLLAGVPSLWLKPGKKVSVEKALTSFGKISFKVYCEEEMHEGRYYKIHGELELPETNKIHEVRVALRFPEKGGLNEVSVKKGVDFTEAKIEGNDIIIFSPKGHLMFSCTWDTEG